MNDIVITSEHNAFRLAGTLAMLNAGAGFAGINIYGDIRPGTPEAAAGSPPLVTIYLADPPGAIDSGLLVLAPGADPLVQVSGNAVWARVFSGNGTTAFDCNVSDEAGTATVKLPSTQLFAGGITRLLSGVLG